MDADQYPIQERLQRDHWWYVGRRRLLGDLFQRTLARSTPFGTVLDIGSGVGGNAAVIRPFCTAMIAVDPSEEALSICRRKGYDRCIRAGLEDLPEGLEADVIVAMDVIEHVADDAAAIRRLFRILRPGGVLILTVPAFQSLWGLQDEVSRHFRRYRLSAVHDLVATSGFELVRTTYFNTVLFVPIWIAKRIFAHWRPRRIRSEGDVNSPFLNAVLKGIFLFEIALLRRGVRFPFGVSALVVAKKPVV